MKTRHEFHEFYPTPKQADFMYEDYLRTYFAIEIMARMTKTPYESTVERDAKIVVRAVEQADLLIAELNKVQE